MCVTILAGLFVMKTPTYISISKQVALMREMETIANNIANVSTTGFRGKHKVFQEFLEKTGVDGKKDRLSFVQDIGDFRNLAAGKLEITNRPYDVAIQGEGYFVIGAPSSNYYTRNGAFTLDAESQLVTSEGFPVLQENGSPLVVPGGYQIGIGHDGTVTATQPGVSNGGGTQIGKLNLVKFADDQALRDAGASEYITDQTPQPASGIVRQGMLESSNVQAVTEITHMISVQRSYEMVNNLVQSEDARDRNMINKLIKSV